MSAERSTPSGPDDIAYANSRAFQGQPTSATPWITFTESRSDDVEGQAKPSLVAERSGERLGST